MKQAVHKRRVLMVRLASRSLQSTHVSTGSVVVMMDSGIWDLDRCCRDWLEASMPSEGNFLNQRKNDARLRLLTTRA